MIATLADDALEAELAGLERRLAQAVRRDDELNGGADGDADRASVAGSSSAKSVGGKTESSDEPEADAHAAARLRQDLEHQVPARLTPPRPRAALLLPQPTPAFLAGRAIPPRAGLQGADLQGVSAAARRRALTSWKCELIAANGLRHQVIDPNGSMGEEWSSVRGEGAMQLLYNGVRARSQLMQVSTDYGPSARATASGPAHVDELRTAYEQVGSEKDFMRLFATKAATGMRPDSIKSSEERRGAARGSADMLRLVRGEVLLSVPGRQGGERRPPGSLIFINGPDIPRNCASSSAGEADIVEILRPRLVRPAIHPASPSASQRTDSVERPGACPGAARGESAGRR